MPRKTDVEAAVVRVLAHAFRICVVVSVCAVPFERHPAAGTIGVARDEMSMVLIAPRVAVPIGSAHKIALVIVCVARKRATLAAIEHLLDQHDPPVLVVLERQHVAARINQPRDAIERIVIERDRVAVSSSLAYP
ncbi:hypothetical protein [Burkholderia diffusa]|uniref:hypothetical protein n=1 Tax=Burkholderia diffusa TaxID=488732 RepID=UPI0020C6232A